MILGRAGVGVPLLAAVLVGPALQAAELPSIAFLSMGYRELHPAEATGPKGPVALTADFTGDGQLDEVRILINDAHDDARVVVVAATPDHIDTFVIDQVDARTGRTLRLSQTIVGGKLAIVVSRPDHRFITVRFDGEEFRKVG